MILGVVVADCSGGHHRFEARSMEAEYHLIGSVTSSPPSASRFTAGHDVAEVRAFGFAGA